jgi:manganese/zinc/iron transport system permease protein
MMLAIVDGLNWTSLDTGIVTAGVLSAASCALLGSFLVLRRMSMMGDAISHAVLPGLAVAFLLTGSRGSLPMFIGAAAVGVLTAMFTQWVHTLGRVDEGASMGVVFTVLFALGLIIIVRAADAVDLDPGCVLYGAIVLVPLDIVQVLGFEVPRAVLTLAAVFTIDLIFVVVFYKELKISAFDPSLATTVGINARLMHYMLMTLVAVTTVAAFESVGSILVIAMLIVPAAAAHLLTDRLSAMLVVAVVIAVVSAVAGHVSAITVPVWFGYADTSTPGMMAVVAGAFFMLAMLFAPRHGVLSKVLHRSLLTIRIVAEDVLGLLYRLEESQLADEAIAGSPLFRDALGASPLMRWAALLSLRRRGQLVRTAGVYRLTDLGRSAARQLVRSHRLWESYLDRHLKIPADHLHQPADRIEHYITEPMADALAHELENNVQDPHGRPIPGPPDA